VLLTERDSQYSTRIDNNVTLREGEGLVCHTQVCADRFDTPFAQVSKLICYILQIKLASRLPFVERETKLRSGLRLDRLRTPSAFADVSHGLSSVVNRFSKIPEGNLFYALLLAGIAIFLFAAAVVMIKQFY
jgi:hypothetical protein